MFIPWLDSLYLHKVPQEGRGTHLLQKLICTLVGRLALFSYLPPLPPPPAPTRLGADPSGGPARRQAGLVSRLRRVRGAGGPRVPPLAHRRWQPRGSGRMEFPAWLSGRGALRPRSLVPEVRAPAGARRRSEHPEGSSAVCPHPPARRSLRAGPDAGWLAGFAAAAPRLGPPPR